MNVDNLQAQLKRQLLTDRKAAIESLAIHAWLLIPDVQGDLLIGGQQGVFREVTFGHDFRADFVVYELYENSIHWQLIHIASPSASILEDSKWSSEFDQAVRQVNLWNEWLSRNSSDFHEVFPGLPLRFSFRIVIGQSRNQTAEEQREVQSLRRGDLRIRSFCWLLEKPIHYSESEITILEEFGKARTALEFK